MARETLVSITAEIVTAIVANNKVEPAGVGGLLATVFETLSSHGADAQKPKAEPAVSISKSVSKSHLVCLEDGKPFKSLKRHLMTSHGLTPEGYRERWGLPADYPMVASDYVKKRRELALQIGLGRKPGQRRGRRKAATKK
ncbi:transcriptional regulator [Altererythrobacter salegens]|uniref:Transcriptional regulator n=2 Tax=Croceibacterium salegens TaxID=1737568 RepID=A0A6I4STE2_9SPHN|nr:transcriptional regulator [Croceibacterium salegens]